MREIISRFPCGNMEVLYTNEAGVVSMLLIPSGMEGQIAWEKSEGKNKCAAQPLIQYKLAGSIYADHFANGLTWRGNEDVKSLKYVRQERQGDEIVTFFTNQHGHTLEHHLLLRPEAGNADCWTVFRNTGDTPTVLQMISSFSLDGLTPFAVQEETDTLVLHRLQSFWSAEGKLYSTPLEDLLLEQSWSDYGMRCEKFGTVGSMPIRRFFPYAAIEDTAAGVIWGAQLGCPSSWQMEVSRFDLGVSLNGGLADEDYGHWRKEIAVGETFETPRATLACVTGSLDELAYCMTRHCWNRETAVTSERDLPVMFNEFCTTWGNPTDENIRAIVDRIKGRGYGYFVIDAGWYAGKKGWDCSMGDWIVNPTMFPDGIKATADYIRACGMKPGIWFELESVGVNAEAFEWTDHLLKRDGVPITVGSRRFWDMRDPWVVDYLTERVIGLLKTCGFEYIKIDYNENIGVGADGTESYGETLRQNMLASQAFYRRIAEMVPGIIIENCSSGGHRLEPSFMELTSMASFSDAHECTSIPIIAANVQRAIHPAKSQIWAVLHKTDSDDRIRYSLCNGFLGRLCLSGEVHHLSEHQWDMVDQAVTLYRKCAPIIADGFTRRFGAPVKRYRTPEGVQAVVRFSGNEALLVAHNFINADSVPFGDCGLAGYQVTETFGNNLCTIQNGCVTLTPQGDFQAQVLLLKKV